MSLFTLFNKENRPYLWSSLNNRVTTTASSAWVAAEFASMSGMLNSLLTIGFTAAAGIGVYREAKANHPNLKPWRDTLDALESEGTEPERSYYLFPPSSPKL
jgi:hypothetical protein